MSLFSITFRYMNFLKNNLGKIPTLMAVTSLVIVTLAGQVSGANEIEPYLENALLRASVFSLIGGNLQNCFFIGRQVIKR